uniref:Uncharacterized protein n=1 Tax=Rhizophora mucronata TaxID=61149 RepID=A0A2P2NJT8_RHIMU
MVQATSGILYFFNVFTMLIVNPFRVDYKYNTTFQQPYEASIQGIIQALTMVA